MAINFLGFSKTSDHSVHWGINPPSKTPTPLSCKAPLKSANCPSPPPLGNPLPLYWFFTKAPPPKNQIFQSTPKILKFFILHPILSFKITKFLVKIRIVRILGYDRRLGRRFTLPPLPAERGGCIICRSYKPFQTTI